jgi:hypothetical protein
MTRLDDGIYALLSPSGPARLGQTAAPPASTSPLGEPLDGGDIAPTTEAADPVVLARLETLGRGFAWHLGDDEARQKAATQARADAASMKSFGSLLACPILPESAAHIAHRLAPLADGGEVLAFDHQAAVALALARGGTKVTLRTADETLAKAMEDMAARDALELAVSRGGVHEAFPEELRARFRLALVDTLAVEGAVALALCRAMSALGDGGRVVSLVHSMRREWMRRTLEELPLTVQTPLHEVAVRLHPGWCLDAFLWDEWILAPEGDAPVAADKRLSRAGAEDLEPSERKPGCLEVVGLDPAGLSGAALDAALDLAFADEGREPLKRHAHDDDAGLRRFAALDDGGLLALSARDDVVSLDLFPWSPALLARVVGALVTCLPRAAEEVPVG